MDSIGEQLRQERERRELTLQQVAESTKITIQNLEAIEEDRFEFFPNRVYARAFLRDYANFLGLDSAGLLDRYEQERAAVAEAPEPEPQIRIAPKRRWRALGWAGLVVLIAAAAALVAYIGYNDSLDLSRSRHPKHRTSRVSSTGVLPKPTAPTSEPVPAPAPKPTATANSTTAAPAQPKPSAGASMTTAAAPAQPVLSKRVTIKVTALGTVWVGVKVDGQRPLWETVNAGTTRTFEGKNISVRAGRGNAVQIEENGKKSLLGPSVAPLTKSFAPSRMPSAGAAP
jgi:cytoskeletal protein RodZ